MPEIQDRKLMIILDSNSIMHRSFHALPPLNTRDGELVNAVFGFSSILLSILIQEKPFYIAAAFDTKAPTFRHQAYKEYKAGRVKAPDEFYQQIPRIEEIVRSLNIPMFKKEGVEADDIIGTVVKINERQYPELLNKIVTSDNDALQLVSDKTCVSTLHKGYKATECYFRDDVYTKYGLYPEQIIDYKALQGDASDNISGVRGIGKVSAQKLLKAYGTLDSIYAHLEELPPKLRTPLTKHKDDAYFSQQLATIKTDVEIDYDLNTCKAHEFDEQKVLNLFESLQFYSLMRRLQEWKKMNGVSSNDIASLFPSNTRFLAKPQQRAFPIDQNALF